MQDSIIIAMSTEERGQNMVTALGNVTQNCVVITDVEELLFQTRTEGPDAMVIEHALVERVSQLDLISLLRRRKPLEAMPLIYMGPNTPEVHASAIKSGVDTYLNLPTRPEILQAHLHRLLQRRQSEKGLREALNRLRAFEQAYKESERVKDDLTHMLVHDLKSPIASVMGLLDHSLDLLGSQSDADSALDLLNLARNEAQHLLNLAANILDVRRMKEGHMPFQPDVIESLSAIAQESFHDVSGGPREREFSFVVRPEAERLYADPGLMRRIIANLLSNAIKHTRRGGYIDFRAWKEETRYVISVRDDGEGIPEQDQKRIFNAFEQSRHTVHDRYDTGMGLTFCKLAVEKHGGEIWVESKVGRGSTFFFTLPLNIRDTYTGESVAVASY